MQRAAHTQWRGRGGRGEWGGEGGGGKKVKISKAHIKLDKRFTRAITMIYSFLCDFHDHIKIALAR